MSPRVLASAIPLALVLFATRSARADLGEPSGAAPPPDPPPATPAPPPETPPPAWPPPPGWQPPPVVVVPYPPPAYPAFAPPEAQPEKRRGFSAKTWAGFGYRRIYDVPIYGADFGVSLGAQRGIYGEMEALVGRTDQGLLAFQLRPGATFEWPIGRVRLGLGVGFGIIGIARATTGNLMMGFGVGAKGFVTVDLVSTPKHALYLGAKIGVDWLPGGRNDADAFPWGPSVVLGWRY